MAIAGKFRNKVVVQEADYTSNDIETRPTTWADVATVYAEIKNGGLTRGGERQERGQTVELRETLFRIRKPKAWTPVAKDMRISFGGAYYYIVKVDDFNYPDRVDLWAEKRDNQQ